MNDLTHILSQLPEPHVVIDGYDKDGNLHLCLREDSPELQWLDYNLNPKDYNIEQWKYSEPRKTIYINDKGTHTIKIDAPLPKEWKRAIQEKHQWMDDFQNSNTTELKKGTKYLDFDEDLYSVFSSRCKLHERNIWVEILKFFIGDLEDVNTAEDFRFKEVQGKREEAKFLGRCHTNFPVKYPLRLHTGLIINKKDYFTTQE